VTVPTTEQAARARRRPQRRALVGWIVLAGICFALDGLVGLIVAILVGLALASRQPPRRLMASGAVLLAILPVVVLSHGLPSANTISATFASHDTLATDVAFAGLALFVAGLLVDGLQRRNQPDEPDE
jgi:predicted dienelactone hydrolase